jgi:hypothetical protein
VGWTSNPALAPMVSDLMSKNAAGSPVGTDGMWSNYLGNLYQGIGPSSGGMYDATLMQGAKAGRDISTGAGVDPRTAAAGGGDQWAVTTAEQNARREGNAGNVANAVGSETSRAVGEGGRYEAERAKQEDQFNLDKYKIASKGIAGSSRYVANPMWGLLSSVMGGAGKGIGQAFNKDDGGGGAGNTESIDFGPGGYTPGQMPGDEWNLPGMQGPGQSDLGTYYG